LNGGKVSGTEFLKATVVAYEACLRLSKAMQPRLKEKGMHATGVVAGVGAALGVGFALGYTKEQLKSVLAAAATSSSGILEVIRDESQLKPFNSGQASMNGLAAGLSGKANMMCPNDVLGGSQGFFFVNSDTSSESKLLEEVDGALINSIYVKPYAACRHAHAPVEATLHLKEEHGIDVEAIESVSVETYKFAVALHDHQEVNSTASAKMSTPYAVAAALVYGKVGLEQFKEEALMNETVQALCKKITVLESAELSSQVPAKRAAIVRIKMKNKVTFEHKVDFPKGEPENPLSKTEMDDKFSSLMKFAGVSGARQSEILDIVDNLEVRMEELYDYL
jgi:2-methylcitrate dehydratase PrpD